MPWSVALCSCIEWRVLNAWMVGVEVVGALGVSIASTTKTTVGGGCCRWAHWTVRCATGHYSVRQPRHPTVRVLTVSTVGALSSSGTGQSGVAPGRYCSLSGVPLTSALTCVANCSDVRGTVQSTVALKSSCSTVTPDSLVAHRTVR